MTTAADELKTAAARLRALAEVAALRRPTPWRPGTAGSVTSHREGGYDYVTGYTIPDGPEIADYIATMHPGVGAALADWLDSWTGIDVSEHAAMPDDLRHALAVARQINTGDRS